MMLALLAKEVREHWLVLLALGALAALLFAMTAIAQFHGGLPAFEILRIHMLLSVPIAAWTLGGRLVRREYAGSTQLFLDALPVPRAAVVTSKFVLGAAAIALCVLPAFAYCWLMSLRGQDLTPRFLAIVGARTAGATWFLWSAAFLLGFLGRYRAPLLIATLLGGAILLHDTDVEATDFGPLALLGHTFAFERNVVPWTGLAAACGTAIGLIAISYFVASLREGSVAARLAQEMSQRERAFAGVAVLAAMFGAATLRDKRPKKPFDPPAAHTEERAGLRIVVGAGAGLSDEDARRLATETFTRIDTMRRDLAIPELPPVFLFARRGLDAERYEHGTIEDEAGIVVRIGYPDPAWDGARFAGWLAQRLVEEHTHGRAHLERRRWVLDGYREVLASGSALDAPLSADPQLLARAVHGAEGGVTRERLARWTSFCDEVGEDVARAVAWSGIRVVARTHGAERARAFLAETLGREPPDDLRALWYESEHGIEPALQSTAATDLAALLRDWNAELETARAAATAAAGAAAPPVPPTSTVPRITADLRIVSVSDASFELELTARLDPAPPEGSSVRFEWVSLGAFETNATEERWTSDETPGAEAALGWRIRHSFHRGERIAWRVACHSEALGCDVVSPLRRTVIE